MEISATDYLKIDFDKSTKMLKALWYAESGGLRTESFKQELYKWRDAIIECQPKLLFVDSRNMNFTIVPELQKWFVTDIFTVYASAGVKRNAFVESEAIFTSISIEQTIEENVNAPFETMYFNNEAKAMKWLLDMK